MKVIISSLGFILLMTGHSFGFGVGNHENLTKLAVEQYNRCQSTKDKKVTEADEGFIVAGNLGEDNQPVLDRAKLWHFYKHERELDEAGSKGMPQFLRDKVEATSFNAYFDQMVDGELNGLLQKEPQNSGFIYKKLGQTIHYIQDVSVPAHVIPIFHPVFSSSHLPKGDTFDKFDVDISTKDLGCDALAADSNSVSLQQIMKENVAATERSLANNQATDWSCFWDGAIDPTTGFGHYGESGNTFGPKSWFFYWEKDRTYTCKGKIFKIEKRIFTEFAKKRQIAAIEATMRAIATVQLQLRP